MESVFTQISVLLGLTFVVAYIMRLFRQPLMTGYLLAGVIAGSFFVHSFHLETEMFDALAEFGVVLLLFVVGLSLQVEHIKKIGKVALVAGISQVFFTAASSFAILYLLGFALVPALYLGVAITFSSTIIIVKLLWDKKDSESVYGRYVMGIMVVQDLTALAVMIALTAVGTGEAMSFVLLELLAKGLMLMSFVYILARWVVPKILDHIASSGEFLFVFTIAWCFGVASALHAFGFSVEVGALIAGLTLGSSPYQMQISSRIKPLRDFFIIIFFIILGSGFNLSNIGSIWVPGSTIALFVLVCNPIILYTAFRCLKFTRRNSFLAGTTAAQVSEFGFILLFTGKQLGIVGSAELELFTFVALVTIILSSYLITYNRQLYTFFMPVFGFFGKDKYLQKEEKKATYDVWVFGYHRIGWKVCEVLRQKNISFAVVDFNPEALAKLRRRGIAAYFGDAADVEFLATIPLEKAKIVLSTLPDADDQITLFEYVRKNSKKTICVGNLYNKNSLDELYASGADYVNLPHYLSGNWVASIIDEKPWTKKTFRDLRKQQTKEIHLPFSDLPTY